MFVASCHGLVLQAEPETHDTGESSTSVMVFEEFLEALARMCYVKFSGRVGEANIQWAAESDQ